MPISDDKIPLLNKNVYYKLLDINSTQVLHCAQGVHLIPIHQIIGIVAW